MRTSHNALLDVKLLAEVYLELMGGKQPGFELAAANTRPALPGAVIAAPVARTPILVQPSEAELAAHAAFVAKRLKDPVWQQPPFADAPKAEA
jgi:DNA polymerase-3 subunit epsilon